VASLSQGRTAAAQCGLFTHKSVPVIFEPPCTIPNTCTKTEAQQPNFGPYPLILNIILQMFYTGPVLHSNC